MVLEYEPAQLSLVFEVRHQPNLSLKRTQTLAGLVRLARNR